MVRKMIIDLTNFARPVDLCFAEDNLWINFRIFGYNRWIMLSIWF